MLQIDLEEKIQNLEKNQNLEKFINNFKNLIQSINYSITNQLEIIKLINFIE